MQKYHRIERSYGSFVRTFSLPDMIDEEKAKEEFKDGVLNLHLPKLEKANPKAIEVKVAEVGLKRSPEPKARLGRLAFVFNPLEF